MKRFLVSGLLVLLFASLTLMTPSKGYTQGTCEGVQLKSSMIKADQVISLVIVSNNRTLTAGETNIKPSSPLDPSLYDGKGTWVPATPVKFLSPYWLKPSTNPSYAVSRAVWISTSDYWTEGPGDWWRLFKTEFTLPPDITIQSAVVTAFTPDDEGEVWFGGSVIGTTGNVYGVSPINKTEDPMHWSKVTGNYTFKPISGLNTLYFVERNYDQNNPNTTTNPHGILFNVVIEYVLAPKSNIPGESVEIVVLGIAGAIVVLSITRVKRSEQEKI